MMSSRMVNPNAMAPTSDIDFSFGPMQTPQQPYVGFDAGGGMAMPGGERSLLQQHNSFYDSFDLAAAAAGCFPFQDSGLLPHSTLPLVPPPSMAMAMPPSLHQPLPLPAGVPTAAELYHSFGGGSGGGFLKREDGPLVDACGGGGGGGTIGLNLGRRTYFSPADVLAVDRLLTRSRLAGGAGMGMGLGMGVLGLGLGGAAAHHHHQPPRCQAEGCKADLSAAKHYHRRHKVCEYHAKAPAVAAAGKQQRFCQQCSRFHVLTEFDEAKRSCRKRLTEHNRRRRKPAGAQGKDSSSSPPPPKRADTSITTSYSSDHHKSASTTAAKSTAISPNGSGVSCLDAMDNGQTSSAAAAAVAPTALSLAALPLHDGATKDDDGGLDSMLMHQQVQGRDDDDEEEHHRFMTSLVMQQQNQQNISGGGGGHGGHDGGVGVGVGGGGNVLSCSSVSDHQQNGGCNGFFEVDFI